MGNIASTDTASCFSCKCNNASQAYNKEFAPEKPGQDNNYDDVQKITKSSGRKTKSTQKPSDFNQETNQMQSFNNAQTGKSLTTHTYLGMQGLSLVSVHQLQSANKLHINVSQQPVEDDFRQSNKHLFQYQAPPKESFIHPIGIIHQESTQKPKFQTYHDIPEQKDLVRSGIEINIQKDRSQIILDKLIDDKFVSSFTLVKHIKKEVFGDMFLVKMNKSGELRILRKIKKAVLRKESQNDQVDDFRFDLEELLVLEHPNIAAIYDFKEDMHNFYILEEYCQGGRLFSQIEELTEMTENLAAEIIRQIFSTITYMHSKSLVYRNLSPDVLLLEDTKNIQDGINLKLINITVQKVAKASKHTFMMSPIYLQAPEVLKQQLITEKCDVWACGILLSILVSGSPPYQLEGASNMMLNAVVEGQLNFESDIWKECQPEVLTFVKSLLEMDYQKRTKSVLAISNKWIIGLTKGKKNNQKKTLNQIVLQKLKSFIAEYRLIEALNEIVQQIQINKDEEKILTEICKKKDQTQEGDLKMDDLRDVYYEYTGKYCDKEEIDLVLSGCTIMIAKKGMIKYSQFISVKSKRAIDIIKKRVKKAFIVYDQRKQEDQDDGYKKGLVSKDEIKKLIRCIMRSNNNQSDAVMSDYDEDQDGYLSIDELIKLIVTLSSHL